ncbi:MAG: tyrosine-type recombinase/integrase [bacterium]
MKGSIRWQVTEIFKEIKEIGSSKHEAKNKARAEGAHGSHAIAEKTEIYGINTFDNYRNAVVGFGIWAKENLDLKDLTKTAAVDIKAYLDCRIAEGVAHKTFMRDKSALNKFEGALNKYAKSHNLNRTYDFKLNDVFGRDIHKSLKHADVTAYDQKTVEKLLGINNKAVNIAVRCALNAGLRKSEILKLSFKCEGIEEDIIKVFGGKGGKNRIVSEISDKTLIDDIKAFLRENNLSELGDAITGNKINNEIRKVLGDSGSIHALRHNYAINCIKEFEGKGFSHIEAIHKTSTELGHNRNEIIEGVYSK